MSLLQGPALALPLVLAAVPLGLCVDRYSRVRLLLLATLLSAIGTVCTALASSFGLLLIARTLVGLAAPATAIAAYSLLADLYSSAQRGRATTVVMLGQVGGSSLAFALGGEVLSRFSDASSGWRWTMIYMAALLVPIIALTFSLREPTRVDQINSKPRARDIWPQLRPYRSFIITLVAGMAMVNLADGAALVWAAPTLSRNFGLHSDRIGTVMALALLVGGILGPMAGGILADTCQRSGGPRRTMTALSVLALLGAPAGCFAAFPEVVTAGLLLALFLLIGSAISVMVTALSVVVIPNELRGLCMSVEFAAGALFGLGLAPMTVSLLSGAIGGPAAIGKALSIVCAVTGLAGAALFAHSRALPGRVGSDRLGNRMELI